MPGRPCSYKLRLSWKTAACHHHAPALPLSGHRTKRLLSSARSAHPEDRSLLTLKVAYHLGSEQQVGVPQ